MNQNLKIGVFWFNIIMAANSVHALFEDIKRLAGVPVISIAEVTAREAARLGMKKLLLLGIRCHYAAPN